MSARATRPSYGVDLRRDDGVVLGARQAGEALGQLRVVAALERADHAGPEAEPLAPVLDVRLELGDDRLGRRELEVGGPQPDGIALALHRRHRGGLVAQLAHAVVGEPVAALRPPRAARHLVGRHETRLLHAAQLRVDLTVRRVPDVADRAVETLREVIAGPGTGAQRGEDGEAEVHGRAGRHCTPIPVS